MKARARDSEVILAAYANGPDQLETAIEDLTDSDLELALRPDSWTIRQIVHHLVDGDDLWKAAIKAALGDSRALFTFQWYWEIPQDEWAKHWNYAGRPIEPSLALFHANRRHVAQILERHPNAWERYTLITLPDGEERPVSISYVVEMQTQHVTDHIADIQKIRQAHKR